MTNKKIYVQIIGNYLNGLHTELQQNNIHCEPAIDICSPLAMAGNTDPSFLPHCDNLETPMLTVLNIRKNLKQMLSHKEENYCSNFNLQPLGVEVRKKNICEYVIVMNSFAVCPLYEKDGIVYSEMWQDTDFIRKIRNDSSFKRRTFPFDEDFNWKFYYDHFIEAIKSEFDRNHIIFIKCNCAQWYMDNTEIAAFHAQRSSDFRNMIEEIDNYFIEKTHCVVIDEQFNHIPPKSEPNRQFPYILMSENAADKIAKEIVNIINSPKIPDKYYSFIAKSSCELYERLINRLSPQTIKNKQEALSKIEASWLTVDDLKKSAGADEFVADLVKLERFIDKKKYTLSNYALSTIPSIKSGKAKANTELIKAYAKYFPLDINDAIAVYKLFEYSQSEKDSFKEIAQAFLNNQDFLPLNSSKKLFYENVEFLKNYPYLNAELPEGFNHNTAFIELENNTFLIIDSESDEPFKITDKIVKSDFDYAKVIENGYYCPAEYADSLTYSYEYYAEKARKGDGAKPTYLEFRSIEHFYETLNYIDYKELLTSENFVFYFHGADATAIVPDNYAPNVDFTVFMDPDTVIVRVQNGLADQMCHYMLGQAISELTHRRVIYYDLPCVECNGCELKKFANKPIELFSEKISNRLFQFESDFTMNKLLKINDYTLITDNGYFEGIFKRVWWSAAGLFCVDLEKYINTHIPYSYYYRLIGIHNLISVFRIKLSDYIQFPPFETESHKALSQKMLSCDSVVVHVRRGDLVTVGWDTDTAYYIEAIQRVMNFTQYTNKVFFIFSDDIPWCKKHYADIGLNLVNDCEINFVEGNSLDDSFRDIQLMALGKIMIIGDSNFSRTAAIYNDNCELMYCGNKKFFDTYQKNVRQNKFDEVTYPFTKDYARPYVHTKPKKT